SRSALSRRLASATVSVPPLRGRIDDLPAVCTRWLARTASRHGRPARSFTSEAMAKLASYPWPGNLAELSAVVGRAALLCPSATVASSYVVLRQSEENTTPDRFDVATAAVALPVQLDDLERRELCSALERCGGNKAEVARLLGIQRTTLYY